MAKAKRKQKENGVFFTWSGKDTVSVFEVSAGREIGRIDLSRAQLLKLMAFGFGLHVIPRTGPNRCVATIEDLTT